MSQLHPGIDAAGRLVRAAPRVDPLGFERTKSPPQTKLKYKYRRGFSTECNAILHSGAELDGFQSHPRTGVTSVTRLSGPKMTLNETCIGVILR